MTNATVTIPDTTETTTAPVKAKRARKAGTTTPKWGFFTFAKGKLESHADKAALVAAVEKLGPDCRVLHGHEMRVATKVTLELKR